MFLAEDELLCEIKNHTNPVNIVRFSPNGLMLAAGKKKQTVI